MVAKAAQALGMDIYIPTLFSKTGKSLPVPLIRSGEQCLGAPRPWQPFHNGSLLPEEVRSRILRCPQMSPP